MIEIGNINYTICYDTTIGERREGNMKVNQIINWIKYMIYKEMERMKNRFKIIITIDTTTGDISGRLEANRDCNIVGIEWK